MKGKESAFEPEFVQGFRDPGEYDRVEQWR